MDILIRKPPKYPPDFFDGATIGNWVPQHLLPKITTGRLLVVENYRSREKFRLPQSPKERYSYALWTRRHMHDAFPSIKKREKRLSDWLRLDARKSHHPGKVWRKVTIVPQASGVRYSTWTRFPKSASEYSIPRYYLDNRNLIGKE